MPITTTILRQRNLFLDKIKPKMSSFRFSVIMIKILAFISLFALIMLLLILPIPERVGSIDFRPYWSASYLFSRGLDFGDLQVLDQVKRNLTAWDEDFTMQAWFTPIGHLLLAPLTLLPFFTAARFWLLSNILVLSLSSLFLASDVPSKTWLPLVGVFSYSMSLTSLMFGQVNTLSLLGFALYFYFRSKNKNLLAGISLLLLLIKPHLVIVTLPLLIT